MPAGNRECLLNVRAVPMADVPTPEQFHDTAELRAALRRFLRRSGEISRRHGLTPRYHLLLLMIKGAPDRRERSTVTELAERLQLTQSTVTGLVQRAEQEGLVWREQSAKDGRVIHLRLTEEGELRLSGSVAEHGPERELLFDILSRLKP
jgi:DNA-binding MarR family transcriptional regulator